MKNLFFFIFIFISLNSFAWNPFDRNKKIMTNLNSTDYSLLKIQVNKGIGNTLDFKVYNGLSSALWCDSIKVTEKNSTSYQVKNNLFISKKDIQVFTVKVFDVEKLNTANLDDCQCEKINGKGSCLD